MLASFLHIRLLQLWREAQLLGWFYTLLIMAGLVFGAIGMYIQLQSPGMGWYILGGWLAILLSIHVKRGDRHFVATVVDQPWKVYTTEYGLLSVPLLTLLVVTGNVLEAGLAIGGVLGISFFNLSIPTGLAWKSVANLVPNQNFEWKSGVRQYYLYLLPLYAAALGLCWFPYVSLILLWLVLGLIASFYQYGESLPMLFAPEVSARQFLLQKLGRHIKHYYLFIGPVLVLYTIFNWQTVGITLLFLLLSTLVLSFLVLSKYTVYQPNERITANSIYVGIVYISVMIPYLLPIPLLMTIRSWFVAQKHLNRWLYVYD